MATPLGITLCAGKRLAAGLAAEFLFQIVDIDTALAEVAVANQILLQVDIGFNAFHQQLVEGIPHPRQGYFAIRAPGDQLAD